jgi:vancomycin resistance protein VanJ
VRVRGRRVEFITVHYSTALPRPLRERLWHHPRHNMQVAAAVRIEQTAHLAAAVRDARRPLVVGGDFNSPPGSHACKTLEDLLDGTFAAGGSGFGWTFPARRPLLRIDHLFVSDELRVLNCRVLATLASDHRPVVADLAWR